MPRAEHVIIIGAGSTGAAVAYDLALRGFSVTVVERGEAASGTTGRNHALLHSGGRYAVHDHESARQCAAENAILRRIAPEVIEPTGGLFAALDEEDESYLQAFLQHCAVAGIYTRLLPTSEALRLEPLLNPTLRVAVHVADGVLDPYRLTLAFLASAQAHGARVLTQCRVTGFIHTGRSISGIRITDSVSNTTDEICGDLVINAAGPWGARVAALAGLSVPIVPSAGVMVALDRRLCGMVISRLRPPGDGDIIVPQRSTTLLGTTSWTTDELDPVPVPEDHIEQIVAEGANLLPLVRETPVKAGFASARPLIRGNLEANGREISRGFQILDHGRLNGQPGLLTIAGGKTTTSRLMAEQVGDQICRLLGVDEPCRTAHIPLAPYSRYRFEWHRKGGQAL